MGAIRNTRADPEAEAAMHRLVIMAGGFGIFVSIAGCATAPPASYDKPGVSAEQRKADERECVQASIDSREGQRAGFFVPVDRDAYVKCMVARGYVAKPAP
jgi:hypothetical protein